MRAKDDIATAAHFLIGVIVVVVVVGFLAVIGAVVYLNYQDGQSKAEPKICTIKEKYTTSRDGHLTDRAMRTTCGKLSVGKRVKVWDVIEEGKTYELMVKGGRTGLPDVVAAKEVKP